MTQTIPPQVYEQMIVLDSCVVIEALKNPLVGAAVGATVAAGAAATPNPVKSLAW